MAGTLLTLCRWQMKRRVTSNSVLDFEPPLNGRHKQTIPMESKEQKAKQWQRAYEAKQQQTKKPKTYTVINWPAVAGMAFCLNVLGPLGFCIWDGTPFPFYFFTTICTGMIYIPVVYQLIRNHKNRNT